MTPSEDTRNLRDVVAAVSAALSTTGCRWRTGRHFREAGRTAAVDARRSAARDSHALPGPSGDPDPNPGVNRRQRADGGHAVQAVLEASFERGRLLNDRDFELLTAAAELGGLVLEAARTRGTPRPVPADGAAPLIGSTPVMASLRERVERVAATDFTVLIEGESGTGKELVARQIHELSRRRGGPFVAVNCAAVVETLLEAELFGIEERTATGRARPARQVRARRRRDAVSRRSVRLVAVGAGQAAARDPGPRRRAGGRHGHAPRRHADRGRDQQAVVGARLAADCSVPTCSIASAASRSTCRRCGSVARTFASWPCYFLARHRATRELTIADAAVDALRLYDWPGNVRELERLMERAVALVASTRIELDDLPPHVCGRYGEVLGPSLAASESMRAWGSRYARLVFERCGRNKRAAARYLDISYHTLEAYLSYGRPQGATGSRTPEWARVPGVSPVRVASIVEDATPMLDDDQSTEPTGE